MGVRCSFNRISQVIFAFSAMIPACFSLNGLKAPIGIKGEPAGDLAGLAIKAPRRVEDVYRVFNYLGMV